MWFVVFLGKVVIVVEIGLLMCMLLVVGSVVLLCVWLLFIFVVLIEIFDMMLLLLVYSRSEVELFVVMRCVGLF